MTFQELVEAHKRNQEVDTSPRQALYSDPLVGQMFYLLERATDRHACAYCGAPTNQIEAAQAAGTDWWDDEAGLPTKEVAYQCPKCSTKLRYRVHPMGYHLWLRIPDGTEGTP